LEDIQRVVICSTAQSIFLLSIEAVFLHHPGLQVLRINPHLPNIVARIIALKPDLVLIGKENSKISTRLLDKDLPLLILDSDRATLATPAGERIPVTGTGDLARSLQKLASPNQLSL